VSREILEDLREGISSAYRQLRELLTTFRLKMDDRGLGRALEETMQEFRARSSADIRLDSRLPPDLVSPNEEVHVLHIVREALSKVIRHASAHWAEVHLHMDDGTDVLTSSKATWVSFRVRGLGDLRASPRRRPWELRAHKIGEDQPQPRRQLEHEVPVVAKGRMGRAPAHARV